MTNYQSPNSASSRNNDTQYNVHNAALKGASSAFSKTPSPPKPLSRTYSGMNGALAAAASVSPKHRLSASSSISSFDVPVRPAFLRQQSTGNSVRSNGSYTSPSVGSLGSTGFLGVPQSEEGRRRSKSPSNIAATLAAARSSPMADKHHDPIEGARDVLPAAGTVKARLNAFGAESPSPSNIATLRKAKTIAGLEGNDGPTDATPIPPTSALVNMFEGSDAKPRPRPVSRASTVSTVAPKTPPPVKAKPRYIASIGLPAASKPGEKSVYALDGYGAKSNIKLPEPTGPPLKHLTKSRAAPPRRTSDRCIKKKDTAEGIVTTPHPTRDAIAQLASKPTSAPKPQRPQIKTTEPSSAVIPMSKPKPDVPAPRRSAKPLSTSQPTDLSSIQALPRPNSPPRNPRNPQKHVSPIDTTSPTLHLPAREAEPTSRSHSANPYARESLRLLEPHMTGDSLADAIVGANLASRSVSPSKTTAPSLPPLPKRRDHHHHHLHLHRSRSPSPPKRVVGDRPYKLKSTMRKKSEESSDEDEIKGRKHFMKHPNKHHEGSRKRWRDRITERERKRYEGVWAANRGLYLPSAPFPPPPSRSVTSLSGNGESDVSALVVRDIWQRSRLPENVLEQVWDLVDSRSQGRLSREEFVVGLWLVDQRLKGRKLPQRVQDSVWDSVTGAGVKMRKLK